MSNQLKGFVIGVAPTCLVSIFFAILKLCGAVDWSWAMVTMPVWIGPLLAIAFVIAALSFYGIQHARGVDLDRKAP